MKVLVTGASGHIGANLVRSLLIGGRPLRALIHHDARALEGLDVEVANGSVCDIDSLYKSFQGVEVVYHLAAQISLSMGDWPLFNSVNVTGTENVVKACIKYSVKRLVHFSSIHSLVQEPMDSPIDELRPLVELHDPHPYNRSKANGERAVFKGIDKGLNAIIINPTAVIGPYDYKPSHFGEVLVRLANRRLPALVAGGFNWVDVRDLVDGAIIAEQKAPRGARYLLSGHWASLKDIAALVEKTTGIPSPKFVCPTWLACASAPLINRLYHFNGNRPLYTAFSIKTLCSNMNISHEKATNELGYRPRQLQQTITDTLHWFEENGYCGSTHKSIVKG
ncbi:NAD-dependent epimerase/dehydratase family protein [Chloroflexota bacterium]